MASLQDFMLPIHRSLQQPDLLLGIPKTVLIIILCLSMIFIYLFGIIYGLIGIIIYIPCCLLSKKDPQMLTIALESLFQPDFLEG